MAAKHAVQACMLDAAQVECHCNVKQHEKVRRMPGHIYI